MKNAGRILRLCWPKFPPFLIQVLSTVVAFLAILRDLGWHKSTHSNDFRICTLDRIIILEVVKMSIDIQLSFEFVRVRNFTISSDLFSIMVINQAKLGTLVKLSLSVATRFNMCQNISA